MVDSFNHRFYFPSWEEIKSAIEEDAPFIEWRTSKLNGMLETRTLTLLGHFVVKELRVCVFCWIMRERNGKVHFLENLHVWIGGNHLWKQKMEFYQPGPAWKSLHKWFPRQKCEEMQENWASPHLHRLHHHTTATLLLLPHHHPLLPWMPRRRQRYNSVDVTAPEILVALLLHTTVTTAVDNTPPSMPHHRPRYFGSNLGCLFSIITSLIVKITTISRIITLHVYPKLY